MNLSDFVLKDGVHCQKNFTTGKFEGEYLNIRTKEGRVYDDETVKKLPFVPDPEWKIRAASAQKLLKQLKKENCGSFIEVGCGNGWLTNYLQRNLDVPAIGIDVNLVELKQAARLSNRDRTTFVYGDIFSDVFKDFEADAIVLAACIQYFPDLPRLINTFKQKGTIHIIDSPIYKTGMAAPARERSKKYFDSRDAAGMEHFYFHHEMDAVRGAEFLYAPNKLKRFFGGSPFPWIRLRKGPSPSSQSK